MRGLSFIKITTQYKNQELKKELENILKEICLRNFDNFSIYSSFFKSGDGLGFN
jgi:hypothetical protein